MTKDASIFLQLFLVVRALPKSDQIFPQLLSKRPLSLPYFSRIAGRGARCSPPTAMVKKNLAQVPIMQGKILHEKCHLAMRNVKLHSSRILLSPLVVTLTAVAAVSHMDSFKAPADTHFLL